MAITVAGVTGKELWEGLKKGRTDSGPYVELGYLVNFGQADAFTDGVMGGIVASGGPGGKVRNVPRLKCPTNPLLYATSAEFVGVGEDATASNGGRPVFQSAVVTVRFEVLSWPAFPSDDPGGQQSFPNEDTPGEPILYAECEIDFGGEYVKLPGGSYKYLSDDVSTVQDHQKWVGVTTWRVTRHWFPYLPHKLVTKLYNRVNEATWLGQPRGCVRFANARTRQQRTSQGTKVQLWELVFEIRERDWNLVIRDDNGKWDSIYAVGDSTIERYPYDDLKPLLAST